MSEGQQAELASSNLCDRHKPVLAYEGEELQRCPCWVFLTALPLTDQPCRDIQISRKHCLAHEFFFTDRFDLRSCKRCNRRKAQLIELAKRLLVHQSGIMQIRCSLMNSCESMAAERPARLSDRWSCCELPVSYLLFLHRGQPLSLFHGLPPKPVIPIV